MRGAGWGAADAVLASKAFVGPPSGRLALGTWLQLGSARTSRVQSSPSPCGLVRRRRRQLEVPRAWPHSNRRMDIERCGPYFEASGSTFHAGIIAQPRSHLHAEPGCRETLATSLCGGRRSCMCTSQTPTARSVNVTAAMIRGDNRCFSCLRDVFRVEAARANVR